jgi:hypothetical protein
LSHVREKPHSIRDFVRVQGADKNSGVARDFMESCPSAQWWNSTAGNSNGRGQAKAFKQARQYKPARA